jgi:hypothetical protein
MLGELSKRRSLECGEGAVERAAPIEKTVESHIGFTVETRPCFLGMHAQPVFPERRLYLKARYPVAEVRVSAFPAYCIERRARLEQDCQGVREVLS